MIKYRPHKGGLHESMKQAKEFDDIADMLNYIEKQWEGYIDKSDIVIGESHGRDDRIGWNSWRYVCSVRCGNEKYPVPQCIGMCDLGELAY